MILANENFVGFISFCLRPLPASFEVRRSIDKKAVQIGLPPPLSSRGSPEVIAVGKEADSENQNNDRRKKCRPRAGAAAVPFFKNNPGQ